MDRCSIASEKFTSIRTWTIRDSDEAHFERPVPTVGRNPTNTKLLINILDRSTPNTDWLEKSITQIDLFGRRHRGMLESRSSHTDVSLEELAFLDEPVEDYFSHNAARHEHDHDDEQ